MRRLKPRPGGRVGSLTYEKTIAGNEAGAWRKEKKMKKIPYKIDGAMTPNGPLREFNGYSFSGDALDAAQFSRCNPLHGVVRCVGNRGYRYFVNGKEFEADDIFE